VDRWDEIQVSGALQKIKQGQDQRIKWMIAGTKPEATTHIECDVVGFPTEGNICTFPNISQKIIHLHKTSPTAQNKFIFG
jgi:hypothetical protein